MPILKQLVTTSSQSKRRSRMDLTPEMISAPLGDFRHTMHVGRSGDAFGDTSFLGTRTGEPPRDGGMQPRSPKLSLLSRTFRNSRRSQSVTRVDRQNEVLTPPGGSPLLVKSAMSLPYLNDRNRSRGDTPVTHSLSSSPLKQQDSGAANGATAAGVSQDPELEEKHFGELTELPTTPLRSAGLKHAVSVLSFHVDLGPSMLGDILGVMEREEDDLGYEEGGNSEDRGSPLLVASGQGEEEEEEEEEVKEARMVFQQLPVQLSSSVDLENQSVGSSTPETSARHPEHLDSCSVSSSGSAAMEEKVPHLLPGGDSDSATFSSPQVGEESFFMDEEEDEIRV
ncbi:cdc42 effector protein 4a [Brienomyrus brachyistius]|uniref:cdc42 effector protein 4a n=1 Tax=Brienomyrus brachyistius TaxID=42636 RepID=UPI0020B27C69|nr:cdc42 effector protein 4a [Brienomyrus brachyistius]